MKYLRLADEIEKSGVSIGELAGMIDLTEEELRAKIFGDGDFTLEEAWYIKRILRSELKLEELFDCEWEDD